MYQTSAFFYRFRFVLAAVAAMAFVIFVADLVTAIGASTILSARTSTSAPSIDTSMSGSPNLVTAGLYSAADGAQHVMLSTGAALYRACRSVTLLSSRSGRTVGRGTVAMVRGTGHGIAYGGRAVGGGIAFTGRTVGSGVMFVLRIPGRAVGSVTNSGSHAVNAVIQPDDISQVPVITAPSAAVLASMTVQERQQIADDQAAQIAANRGLGGRLVAGDPSHGEYPARWDNARQDSTTDSWGMYNRECVSYAAWKVYQTYGTMPYWGGVGNANEWPRDARRAGIPTGSAPQVHSVAISMRGYYGHAMWVEKVSGDMIYVSQYNYDLHGHYSEMWVNGSDFTYIYFK